MGEMEEGTETVPSDCAFTCTVDSSGPVTRFCRLGLHRHVFADRGQPRPPWRPTLCELSPLLKTCSFGGVYSSCVARCRHCGATCGSLVRVSRSTWPIDIGS